MSAPDAIGEIWRTYQVTLDCLKVTEKNITLGQIESLKKTSFMAVPKEVAQRNIHASRETVDDHTILAMWAVFEREMVTVLEFEARKILGVSPSAFNKAVSNKIEAGIEYWRIEDKIDLFKPVMPIELIGYTKQINRYRDWVAHRNPKKPTPAKMTPQFAYEVLAEVLKQMNLSCRT